MCVVGWKLYFICCTDLFGAVYVTSSWLDFPPALCKAATAQGKSAHREEINISIKEFEHILCFKTHTVESLVILAIAELQCSMQLFISAQEL